MLIDILYATLAFLGALIVAGFSPLVPLLSRSRLHTAEKIIALTFDDGPSLFTLKVLEILNAKNFKATFFVVGENTRRHPEILRQAYAAGHQIGNHSDDHVLSKLIIRTPKQQLLNLRATDSAIFTAINKRPRFYRAPHGYRSFLNIVSMYRAGYRSVTWTTMTFDYLDKTPDRYIVKNIVAKSKPGGIIVLHDGLETKPDNLINRQNMIEALPKIIDELRVRGYKFVTVAELFGEPAYRS